MGLMDKLTSPEFAIYLSGLGGALSSAGRGQPFDMSQTNALLARRMMQEKRQERLGGLMDQWNLPPRQRGLMEYMAEYYPRAAMGLMAQQAFPEPGDPYERYRVVGGRLVDLGAEGGPQITIDAPEKTYAMDRKVQAMMDNGVPRERAVAIATGQLAHGIDPVNRQPYALDLAQVQTGDASQPPRPTDALPPEEGGPVSPPQARARPLYGQAEEATGVVPGLKELSTDVLGQIPWGIGEGFSFPETVESRQNFRTAANELIRALSINPKFPVAEMERIRSEIAVLPNAMMSGEGLQARMRSVDRMLRQRLSTEVETAQDSSMPPDARQAAMTNANAIRNFLKTMGVPRGGETTGAPSAAEAQRNMPRPRSKADADALPSGSLFIAPDGSVRRKP